MRIPLNGSEQLEEIKIGCDSIVLEEELLAKLNKSYESQQPLIVKFGADPSRPDLHLGHTVVINKLRTFQKLGHTIKFIIGDFTARIGDPTGRSKLRPQLTLEEVHKNADTYKEQVFKILDPDKTEIVYNGQWLDKLTPIDFIKLMATRTVQQLLAREDFSKRYKEQTPIFLHEFLYPVLQAYDSVVLKSDVELGGTDQTFNLLMGRELQKQESQRPQSLVIMPILEGLDGVQKMSKSYDNYIGLNESPQDMFGKTMSISDDHMIRFYELLSDFSKTQLEELKNNIKSGSLHPMDAKKDLAQNITSTYYGNDKAIAARSDFESRFSKKETPDDLLEHSITMDPDGSVNLIKLSVELEFSKSKSEARRIMKQNGIKIDGKAVNTETITMEKNKSFIFKQGKLKIAKISIL